MPGTDYTQQLLVIMSISRRLLLKQTAMSLHSVDGTLVTLRCINAHYWSDESPTTSCYWYSTGSFLPRWYLCHWLISGPRLRSAFRSFFLKKWINKAAVMLHWTERNEEIDHSNPKSDHVVLPSQNKLLVCFKQGQRSFPQIIWGKNKLG